MVERTMLSTETIRGVRNWLTKNEDELLVRFDGQKERNAFAQWLNDLQKEAQRSPQERYEKVCRQMNPSSPELSE